MMAKGFPEEFKDITQPKAGIDSVHPLRGPELRALKKLLSEYLDATYQKRRLLTAGEDNI